MKRLEHLGKEIEAVRRKLAEADSKRRELCDVKLLLNEDLAAWKKKLRDRANPSSGKWKLIFYATYGSEYRDTLYNPNIFTDEQWLVTEWIRDGVWSERGFTAAFADNPLDLLPPKPSFMRLILFNLPFMIIPSKVEKIPKLQHLGYVGKQYEVFLFGEYGRVRFDETYTGLRPVGKLEHPDLSNPQHVEYLCRKYWNEMEMPSGFSSELEKKEAEIQKMIYQDELCAKGDAFRKRIQESQNF